MEKVQCEVCNSTHLIKDGDFFVCESCGMKYRLADVRNMISGTIEVVKGENTLKDLYDKAFYYKSINHFDEAIGIFHQIQKDFPKEYIPWYEMMTMMFSRVLDYEVNQYKKNHSSLYEIELDIEEFLTYIDEIIVRKNGDKCITFFLEQIDNIKKIIEDYSTYKYTKHTFISNDYYININFMESKPRHFPWIPKYSYQLLIIAAHKLDDLANGLKLFFELDGLGNYMRKIEKEGAYNEITDKSLLSGEKMGFYKNNNREIEFVCDALTKANHCFYYPDVDELDSWKSYEKLNIILYNNFIFIEERGKRDDKCEYTAYEVNNDIFNNLKNWLNMIKEEEEKEKIRINNLKAQNKCQYCGGNFQGLFYSICSKCGREKDY